jgi:hypothetical protein
MSVGADDQVDDQVDDSERGDRCEGCHVDLVETAAVCDRCGRLMCLKCIDEGPLGDDLCGLCA